MRIDSGLPLQNSADVDRAGKKLTQRQAQSCEGVTAQFSSDAIRLSSLEQQANAASEVRQEKVSALRQAIESGEYGVSDATLADAILRDVLHR
jgi:flagellar biosynthesis anti-sigma factor FlgM